MSIIIKQLKTEKRGFTLVETLFYAAGLVVLILAMSGFLYYMYDWYQSVTIAPRIDRIGVSLVDKIVKDIRSGTSVAGSSLFNNNNGYITINTVVNTSNFTKYFALNNGTLTYQYNDGATSYISPSGVTISRFYLTSTSTAVSKGIKFDIDISYRLRATGTSTRTYSGFGIMRQSYE